MVNLLLGERIINSTANGFKERVYLRDLGNFFIDRAQKGYVFSY
jgi:hypothetical protein